MGASLARRLPRPAGIERWVRARLPRHIRQELAADRLLRAFAAAYPRAVFVEIGANDGDQLDHLRSLILKRRWRGVMVEPVPYVFTRLQQNYAAAEGVACENAAIADSDGSRPFYHLGQVAESAHHDLPDWYDAIGSFSRQHVLAHRVAIADIEARVVETTVPCMTFESLCIKHGLQSIDLLVIDTEGYDFEILRHIDFSRYRPVLVGYEHRHLDRTTRSACLDLMGSFGYKILEEGHDTWCLRPDARAKLVRVWRNLRPAVPPIAAYEEPWWSS